MYRLFYNYRTLGDVLMIIFDNESKATRIEKRNSSTVLYNDEKIIGINLFDISKIVRIKADGMILNPATEFIDVINHILLNDGLDPLLYLKDSGFIVGQVIEVIDDGDESGLVLVKLDIGSRVIYAETQDKNLQPFSLVVVALPDVILFDGSTVKIIERNGIYCEGKICTNRDLNFDRDHDGEDIYLVEDNFNVGQDFFMEEK